VALSGLARAEAAVEGRRWLEAAQAFAAADVEEPLGPGALASWGLAAYLCGRDAESDRARTRAFNSYLAAGDVHHAVRVGHWLAVTLVLRGEPAQAGGWFARLQSVLDQFALHDSASQLLLDVSVGMRRLFSGDAVGALDAFERIVAASGRHDDPDLYVLARNGLGQSLVAVGQTDAGLCRLDEVMVAVTSDEAVYPQLAGLMYCAVIDTCRRCFELGRATEWTAVLSRWCGRQTGLTAYRGQCLVHRSELLALHGSWEDALAEIETVFRQLGEDPQDVAAGMAHYQRGELHRLRGELQKAESAYLRAAQCGHDPQPGLAMLRLAQGNVTSARAALHRAMSEAAGQHVRLRLLAAWVEVALAAGDREAAEAAVRELATAVAERDIPWLAATAARAQGHLLLAAGNAGAALPLLRRALSQWQRLGAPYESALTRLLLADACSRVGDTESADLELGAARWALDQLGAMIPGHVVGEQVVRPSPETAASRLSQREIQVLRLVATGASNRLIAQQLFLSEKTIARHVANIFLKLGVNSRSAATALAYEARLV
jgi:DNA-binding CsgD family transcriptional regulator